MIHGASRSCAKAFGIHCSGHFKTIYEVVTGEKRPDLIVFDGEGKPAVIDFSVTHQADDCAEDKTVRRNNVKRHKYADWREEMARIVPLTLTTRATVCDDSTEELCRIERNTSKQGFVRNVKAHMKVAMLNFESFRAQQLASSLRINVPAVPAYSAVID